MEIKTVWDDETQSHLFIVAHDGVGLVRERVDYMTREETLKWVEPLLRKVYALGKKDGYLEGLREAK
jgi:hypothetical protein